LSLPGFPDEPLLATKLMVPPDSAWLVPRPRLLDLVSEGTRGPLTLVAAPAGTGKTMLLASWIHGGRPLGPVAWLSLDPDDNDRGRFWAYVLAGLRASGAVPPDGTLAQLAPPTRGASEAFVRLLINGLGELPDPVVLVLDDLHELTNPSTLADIEYLVRQAPAQLRLVLATRADPAVRLARLRVSGGLTEVRAGELAFSHAEAAELVGALGPALSEAEVAALWTRTEGWAAGLRLASLSLQHHPDPSGFVAAFSGDDRAVADYLIGEVLDRQPAEVREFLLRTSLADRLTGGLADALTGGRDGARRLAELERTNAFVVPLDPNRTAYRYHQLFAELLRAELHRQQPGEVVELHRRAARWHAADGVTSEAIRHALAAGDWRHARDLLVQRGTVLAASPTIFRDLLARMPPDLVRRDPELAMLTAVSRYLDHDLEGVVAYRRLAEQNAAAVPEHRRGWFAAMLAETRLARARLLSDLDGVRAAAHELLRLAPTMDEVSPWALDAAHLQVFALSNLGTAAFWTGDLEAATLHLEASLEAVADRPLMPTEELPRLNCLGYLALVAVASGRLQRAVAVGQAAVGLAERRGWSQALHAFGGHLALAWASYSRGALADADRHLERAGQAAHERTTMASTALLRSWLLSSQGDPATGLSTLRDGVEAARGRTGWPLPPLLAGPVQVSEAELLVAIGDTRAARIALAQAGDPRSSVEAAVAVARLQQAEGDLGGAVTTLAAHLEADQAPPAQPPALLKALLVDAGTRAALGAHEEADRSLERALALAAPEGYRQVFVDSWPPVRALLVRQLEQGTEHPAFVADLLELVGHQAADMAAVPGPLVDPLSDRERTVLRYLASRLSTAEIADELYVSVNTVKTHCKSIYRKLGASGRRHAVDRARRLHQL
jgi:LuxR family maltose regulon positive regulatory protein